MSVCVCSNVCASFVHYCVVVYAYSVLFVCVCACLFAKRVRVVCLRVSLWCCMVYLFVFAIVCLVVCFWFEMLGCCVCELLCDDV